VGRGRFEGETRHADIRSRRDSRAPLPGPRCGDGTDGRRAADRSLRELGFSIGSERWEEDLASGGAPIGDAISSGVISQIAGQGGRLVITYVANAPTDLPAELPAYTLEDPRRANMETWSMLQVVVGVIFFIIFVVFFLTVAGQMSSGSHFGNMP